MKQNETSFKAFIQKNFIQIFSLCMLALATYITYRLAPISEGINKNSDHIQAIEELIPNFVRTTDLEFIQEQLKDIKTDVREIRSAQVKGEK